MRRPTGLLAGIVLLAACGDERIISDAWGTTPDALRIAVSHTGDVPSAAVNKELAALQKATAKFHSIEIAKAAGWSEPITGCMPVIRTTDIARCTHRNVQHSVGSECNEFPSMMRFLRKLVVHDDRLWRGFKMGFNVTYRKTRETSATYSEPSWNATPEGIFKP